MKQLPDPPSSADGGDANEAAITSYNEEQGTHIIRQGKYLNNIVERTIAPSSR